MLMLGVTVRYDKFAGRTLVDGLEGFGPALDDAARNRLWMAMERQFRAKVPIELLHRVVADTARLNEFHPVLDYIGGLEWDGKPRIDTWLATYGGAEDNEYVRAVGALALTAAVRRVKRPGCKFDEMVVLEGLQGTDRSSAMAILAVDQDWFTDDLPLNSDTQKVIERLRGKWIVEAGELSGIGRADVEHLKAFLARRVDRARLAYARVVEEGPRQCVIIGTTNASKYLKDTTGNRRFWPVAIGRFDLDALSRDRDQLWAEAALREAAGASIRLDPALWAAAAAAQEDRLIDDPYVDAIEAALGDMEGKITTEGVWTILDCAPARGRKSTTGVWGTSCAGSGGNAAPSGSAGNS